MHQANIPAGLFDSPDFDALARFGQDHKPFDSSDLEPPDWFARDRGPVERPGRSSVKPAKAEIKSEFQQILPVAENYTMQNLKILGEYLFRGFGLCDLSRAEMLPGEKDQIKRERC